MDAPGKGLLKVSGILMIVFSGIAALLGVIALVGGAAITAVETDEYTVAGEGVAVLGFVAIVVGIIALIGSVYNIVMGIFGVKNCNAPEKWKVCMVLAIISLVWQALNAVASGFGIVTLIGCALPTIYLIGAIQNKNSVQG